MSALRHDEPALVANARQRVTELEAVAAWPGHEGRHIPRGWLVPAELGAPFPHGLLLPCGIEQLRRAVASHQLVELRIGRSQRTASLHPEAGHLAHCGVVGRALD